MLMIFRSQEYTNLQYYGPTGYYEWIKHTYNGEYRPNLGSFFTAIPKDIMEKMGWQVISMPYDEMGKIDDLKKEFG